MSFGEFPLSLHKISRVPTNMLNLSQYFPITDPTLIFFVVLVIILLAPIIMGKLRIPHIIGMVLAGVLIGQYGLNILSRDSSFEIFGKVGLYYIMFLAALEMDTEAMRRNKMQILIFGLITFSIPFALTYFMGVGMLGYSAAGGLILGCIMSSNTLVAYPIVSRYGLQRKPSVMLSVGSTMISLLLALIVLAAIVASHRNNSGIGFWLLFALKFAVFCLGMVLVLPRLTRWFLRRYSDAVMQFIFVMSMMVLSAALSSIVGLEGIFGAFLCGLILSRYIPHVSPLMNRIEFIGNALFIPYFLMGVGMIINVRLLFEGGNILWVVACLTIFGTVGKALAAYLTCMGLRLPWASGHMMFGLTSAHAAGAIAMVMVGRTLETSPGHYLVDDSILNAVVIMILFTCIISTLVTERSAQAIILRNKELPQEGNQDADDEHILIPVKYPEYAEQLVNMAVLMRNPKLHRDLVGLNVVYDDIDMHRNMEEGHQLLDKLTRFAAAADVQMTTQVRVAVNIANGIKHAFTEFRASEIIIGIHMHKELSSRFWGQFQQSLFNGLHRQIFFARLKQPLNTIRRIQVAVPSRAEYEPGFYRWLERLSRLAENLECRILFHGRNDTLSLIQQYVHNRHPHIRAEFHSMPHWNEIPQLASTIGHDHLFAVVTARKGTVSYKNAQEYLPEEITRYFHGQNLLIIFPDQHGAPIDSMTFAQPQHTEVKSAYESLREWMKKGIRRN